MEKSRRKKEKTRTSQECFTRISMNNKKEKKQQQAKQCIVL